MTLLTFPAIPLILAALLLVNPQIHAQDSTATLPVNLQWTASPPLIGPKHVAGIDCHSIKDPSVVRYGDRWHLFCTIRGQQRSHAVVYLSFKDWDEADQAQQHLITAHAGYFCAPQVFFFTPHHKWYMICQAASSDWEPNYQPAFSTADRVDDPAGWSPLQPLYGYKPAHLQGWIDFWVICDSTDAHLFYTSNDGKMWQSRTSLQQFPLGWTDPEITIQGDIFEASHTYAFQSRQGPQETTQFLTLIEAQHGYGWRYFKCYLADQLSGPWREQGQGKERAFASLQNVRHGAQQWTESISHGELLRAGYDERMAVNVDQLTFLFQGVMEADRVGKPYGEIPWQLGLLRAEQDQDR